LSVVIPIKMKIYKNPLLEGQIFDSEAPDNIASKKNLAKGLTPLAAVLGNSNVYPFLLGLFYVKHPALDNFAESHYYVDEVGKAELIKDLKRINFHH